MKKKAKTSKASPLFVWDLGLGLRTIAALLGKALAKAHPHLYRTDQGLIAALPGKNKVRAINNARQLAPMLIDCLDIQVMRGNKIAGGLPPQSALNAMLGTEHFLRHFKPVDVVTFFPVYLADFSLAPHGYHDGGPGQRILCLGPQVQVADTTEAWDRFLAAMHCDSEASRTNILAAAVTLLLRHHWPGQKPLILVTANQSHAGKGTISEAIRGRVPKAAFPYQNKDWPMQAALQQQLNGDPDIGLIDMDNVRKDSGGGGNVIRSALIESLVTSAEMKLNSPTGGPPISRRNDFVFSFNTNEGTVSIDLLNRCIWIHLAPKGDIHEHRSPIGNPKEEYLPQHQQQMEAELHGLIARWRAAGCPVDSNVKHPMTSWSKTVGGILRFGGYKGFLANYRQAAQQIDPQRQALAILGAAKPGVFLRPTEWAELAKELGLAQTLFSVADRGTVGGRERGIGVIFSRVLSVLLEAETETKRLRLKLERLRVRWDSGQNSYVKYQFTVVEELSLEEPPQTQGAEKELGEMTSVVPSANAGTQSQPHTPRTPRTKVAPSRVPTRQRGAGRRRPTKPR